MSTRRDGATALAPVRSPLGGGAPRVARRGLLLLLAFLVAGAAPAAAQQQQRSQSDEPPPIEDNSFLVEEAYNQERGVVQHISTYVQVVKSSAWLYTFTQEWPLGGVRHQLSYSIPLVHTDREGGGNVGVGDVMLNYRFQAAAADGPGLSFAPRVTAILPTGANRRGLGTGSAGVQVNLPVSVALHAPLVLHSNAGVTYLPHARDPLGDAFNVTTLSLAQSAVWLARPRLNFLLEASWSRTWLGTGEPPGEPYTSLLLSPGVRGAIDFASGLQIVPGLAFPVEVWQHGAQKHVFVYLSFEHPFGAPPPSERAAPSPRGGP